MYQELRASIVMLLLMTVLTGLVYPLVVTGIAQAVFPGEANGSLISHNGKVVGSSLIGQSFTDPKYFWSRPSATAPYPYNAASSTGSNLGPTNPALLDAVKARVVALKAADPDQKAPVPVDLVTASGSGLDPDISLAAALYQVPRIARLRHVSEQQLRDLVADYTKPRTFDVLGEPRVNVLELNLALDGIKQ